GPPSWDGSENSGAGCPIWGTSAAMAAANGNTSSAKAVKMRCLKLIALSWCEDTTFRSICAKSGLHPALRCTGFGIMQTERHRMDETQLQNALDELLRLCAGTDTRLTAVEQRLNTIELTMATKKDLAEITHAVTHYGKYVEGMLNAFAKTSLSHEDQIEELRQRVAALEKRVPPQAA